MALAVETERHYLIPIADTDTEWQQICAIPVTHTKLQIPGFATITHLRFPIIFEGRLSRVPLPLDILAGGENPEIAGQRIRAQMIHRLETALKALQKPNPPLNARLQIQQLSPYFEFTLPEQF